MPTTRPGRCTSLSPAPVPVTLTAYPDPEVEDCRERSASRAVIRFRAPTIVIDPSDSMHAGSTATLAHCAPPKHAHRGRRRQQQHLHAERNETSEGMYPVPYPSPPRPLADSLASLSAPNLRLYGGPSPDGEEHDTAAPKPLRIPAKLRPRSGGRVPVGFPLNLLTLLNPASPARTFKGKRKKAVRRKKR
ncbi:hypothetical protein EXIGLDRAFT_770032 [Exidia glandulosa HHB12029]|uniref:Uncharacterized protein n=1 Tax=Exidia glandulosa HHB12029 TaxID=1314781 RepID=A0A165H1E7_EXIGL|nr:hypothetical protein EXIGLDRAFT_770032 [Exidia glandulosa HHB12029]